MKYTYLLLFNLLVIFSAVSQTKPEHPKKVFQNPEGKLFWPQSLPVYIRLAASPHDSTTTYLMQSETTAKYADPCYLDTEGVNYIRTQWAVDPVSQQPVYPQMEVMWEVYRDGLPPVTRLMAENGKEKNLRIYSGSQLSVNLQARDEMSGVDAVYYSLNGNNWLRFNQNLELKEEKNYVLNYYAVDNVGNAEEIQSKEFTIDHSAPVTSLNFIGEHQDNVVSAQVQIKLETSDLHQDNLNIFYSFDDDAENKFSKPLALNKLPEGEHTITYYATDDLGNREEKQSLTFFVDNTPPLITSDILGDRYMSNGKEYSSGRARIKLTAIDNKAGIKEIHYSVNGEPYQLYDGPFYLKGKAGKQEIKYFAVDKVGNKSFSVAGTESVSMPYLDLTGPDLNSEFIGNTFTTRDTLFINQHTRIKLSGFDKESGLLSITYNLDQQGEVTYKEPFSITQEGSHKISIYGYDQVNNSNKKDLVVIVDNESPEINAEFGVFPIGKREIEGKKIDIYPNHLVVFLSAHDRQTGFDKMFFTLEGQQELPYNSPIQKFIKGKDYNLQIKALDKLGNLTEKSYYFGIEN